MPDYHHLTDHELLTLYLSAHLPVDDAQRAARHLLCTFGSLAGLNADANALSHLEGLDSATIERIAIALEISTRFAAGLPVERPLIRRAEDAARLVTDMHTLAQEHVRVMLLDAGRRVAAVETVYIGTLNASVLRVAELYRPAILRNSPAIILIHNHPTGSPHPSPEDVELTRVIDHAGRLLDIALVDHLIIGERGWVSLREAGLVFER